MKNRTRHEGKLEIIERLPSSPSGNPRYLCRIDVWACCTTPDSDIAYRLPNLDGQRVTAVLGTHYGKCSIDALWAVED